jgi:hypothetical protein
MGNHVLPGLDYSAYIESREKICLKIKNGFDQIQEAIEHAKKGMLFNRTLHKGQRYFERSETDLIGVIDRSAWDYLMKQSGLWSFLDAVSREKWTRGLGGYDPVPEFNSANVEATFRDYYERRSLMRDQGLQNLFRNLSRDYKTNEQHFLGLKCILKLGYWNGLNEGSVNVIDDLARVMCSLDSKPEFDHRISTYEMLTTGNWSEAPWNEFFSLKLFKNKNAHIKFKRLDLLEKLNGEIGRLFPGALPSKIK